MENSRKGMREIGLLSLCALLIGVFCTFILYRFFPQYLCYTMQDIHASDPYERSDLGLSKGMRYTEYFTPTGDYLKSILINLRGNVEGDETLMSWTLLEEDSSVVAKSSVPVGDIVDSVFYEFSIEKWVKNGQVYQFIIEIPADEGVSVTFGPADIGPEEHVNSLLNEGNDESVMYMQYSYGSYSRKLLIFWFLIFTVSAYLIEECFWHRRFSLR